MKTRDFRMDMADECLLNNKNQSKSKVTQSKNSGINVCHTAIRTLEESKIYQRDIGNYYTVDCSGIIFNDGDIEVANRLSGILKSFREALVFEEPRVLVVGLGNRNVVIDSLGNITVDSIKVYKNTLHAISAGVYGLTGIQSVDIVRGVASEIQANLVIIIDTLATSKVQRVFRSFQITDAGLEPGSATSYGRGKINKKSIGVPVVAIGVPTCIYARSIVKESVLNTNENAGNQHIQNAIKKVLGDENLGLLFSVKFEEEGIKKCGKIIAQAINNSF